VKPKPKGWAITSGRFVFHQYPTKYSNSMLTGSRVTCAHSITGVWRRAAGLFSRWTTSLSVCPSPAGVKTEVQYSICPRGVVCFHASRQWPQKGYIQPKPTSEIKPQSMIRNTSKIKSRTIHMKRVIPTKCF
jgi:hypothetical protein